MSGRTIKPTGGAVQNLTKPEDCTLYPVYKPCSDESCCATEGYSKADGPQQYCHNGQIYIVTPLTAEKNCDDPFAGEKKDPATWTVETIENRFLTDANFNLLIQSIFGDVFNADGTLNCAKLAEKCKLATKADLAAIAWTIGDNGNIFIGGKDTGTPAQGPQGDKGDDGADGVSAFIWTIGPNGNWFKDGADQGNPSTGPSGADGADANLFITSGFTGSGTEDDPYVLDCTAVNACSDGGGGGTEPTCVSEVWAAGNTATVVEGSDGKFYKVKAAGDAGNDPAGNTADWLGPFNTCELATAATEEPCEDEKLYEGYIMGSAVDADYDYAVSVDSTILANYAFVEVKVSVGSDDPSGYITNCIPVSSFYTGTTIEHTSVATGIERHYTFTLQSDNSTVNIKLTSPGDRGYTTGGTVGVITGKCSC